MSAYPFVSLSFSSFVHILYFVIKNTVIMFAFLGLVTSVRLQPSLFLSHTLLLGAFQQVQVHRHLQSIYNGAIQPLRQIV
jgi:hypothetical protein